MGCNHNRKKWVEEGRENQVNRTEQQEDKLNIVVIDIRKMNGKENCEKVFQVVLMPIDRGREKEKSIVIIEWESGKYSSG